MQNWREVNNDNEKIKGHAVNQISRQQEDGQNKVLSRIFQFLVTACEQDKSQELRKTKMMPTKRFFYFVLTGLQSRCVVNITRCVCETFR